MLETPQENNQTQVEVQVQDDQNPKYAWVFITILTLVLLFALFWSLTNDDRAVVVIIDDSPNVIVDDQVTVATTDSVIADMPRDYIFLTEPNVNDRVVEESLVVTSVVSDKLFMVSDRIGGIGLYAYLDETLNAGVSEQLIDVDRGDQVVISGVIINNFSDRTFTSSERELIMDQDYLLLVDDIDFVN